MYVCKSKENAHCKISTLPQRTQKIVGNDFGLFITSLNPTPLFIFDTTLYRLSMYDLESKNMKFSIQNVCLVFDFFKSS